MYSASTLWKGETTYLQGVANRLQDKLKQANAIMQSQSGQAVQNAVAPVVLWVQSTADNTSAQSDRMKEQGDAFTTVKNKVPKQSEVQNVPSNHWWDSAWAWVTSSKTDTQKAQEHNEQLRQQAVTAFNGYQNSTKTTVGSTPSFTAPPPIAANTSVQGGTHSGVGSFTSPGGSGHGGAGGVAGSYGGSSGASDGGGGTAGPLSQTHLSGAPVGSPDVTRSASAAPSMPSMPSTAAPNVGGGGPSAGGFAGFSGVLPGAGGGTAGSGSGSGSGGRLSGAGAPEEEEAPPQGGRAGTASQAAAKTGAAGAEEEEENTSSTGTATGQGARGGKPQDDDEHYIPDYLKGDHGFFDDGIPKVAPPVFGE
jgi:hypothetical protein